jgi:transposase
VGRPLAQRLLADGETVVDVPAKLAARVRVFDTGNARKTDAVDAHGVAMAALRTPKLRVLAFEEELVALRLLADRRDELSARRVQTVNRLHRLLTELIPGGAEKNLSATKAKRLLATVKPRSVVGKTTRRLAVEELSDLVATDAKTKSPEKELAAAVRARGSHLMELRGIGPAGAARILADVGDVARGSPTATTSPPGPAPHPWMPPPVSRSDTACPGPETDGSTTSSTSPPSPRSGIPARGAPTTDASPARPRRRRNPCGARSAASPTRSTGSYSPTPSAPRRRPKRRPS